MGVVKKAAPHVAAVVIGMNFIGFSIQIVFGVLWMCCNFMKQQDFGEPDAFLYQNFFCLFGKNPCLLYLLQLGVAFYAGYRLLWKLYLRGLSAGGSKGLRREKAFMAWGSLALLTFPFALQCHLAIQPHSMMGSLFLLMLSFLVDSSALSRGTSGQEGKRALLGSSFVGLKAVRPNRGRGLRKVFYTVLPVILCGGLMVVLSGATDAGRRTNVPKHNIQSALASRMAWADIWNDQDFWTDDLQEMVQDVLWKTSYYPGNMDILLKAIEDKVGEEEAKVYYMQIAKIGWNRHAYMVVRQIGWDALGYMVTPLIFPLQLKGEAYDSFTGRNYEVMRGNSPVLTKYYVDYGCWWFGCCLVLTLCLGFVRAFTAGFAGWKKWIAPVCICAFAAAVVVCLLTMRGAGLMDYKYTAAVNELWLAAALMLISPVFGAGGGNQWSGKESGFEAKVQLSDNRNADEELE